MRHRIHKKTLAAAAVATALGFGAGAAQAETFVYQAFGGWVDGSDDGGESVVFEDNTGTTGTGTAPPTFDVGANKDPFDSGDDRLADLNWGTAQTDTGPYQGKSGLALSGFPLGLSDINADTTFAQLDVDSTDFVRADFGILTHFNRVIESEGQAPDSAEVEWRLRIWVDADKDGQPDDPDNPVVDTDLQRFGLNIWETNNVVGDETCPNASDPGTPVSPAGRDTIFIANGDQASGNPCDDAFQYEELTSFPAGTFQVNGERYEYDLIQGFFPEDNGEDPTDTFWSSEAGTNQAVVKFRIRQVEQPEIIPTMSQWAMGLMTLILGGVAWVGFRRRRNGNDLAI